MRANLRDLLKEINDADTGREPVFNSIVEAFLKKDVPRNEIEGLIDAAWKNLLIKNRDILVKETQKDDAHAPKDVPFILNIPGFELLNQIQINKAIVKFNESSDKSYEKIIDLTGKLGLSVEKLYQSSKRLEDLTRMLIFLTIFLVGLTTILLLSEVLSLADKEILIVITFTITLIALYALPHIKYKK